jgi:hypothetical protein
MSSQRITMYVHIGAGKTGSTSIQSWLKNVESQLSHAGYLIFDNQFQPTCHNLQHDFMSLSNQVDYFLQLNTEGRAGIEQFHTKFHSNLAYMREHGFQRGIISAEYLFDYWDEPHKYFADIKHLCDWKVIAYVRNQPHFLASAWKEWGYMVADFPAWIELFSQRWGNWNKHLESWDYMFGTDSIYLGVLEKSCLVNGSLIDDFQAAIGNPPVVLAESVKLFDNPSISNRTAMALSYLRRMHNGQSDQPLHLINPDYKQQNPENFAKWQKYEQKMLQLFQIKGPLQQQAPNVSVLRQEQAVDLFDSQLLDYVNRYYFSSNQELLAKYRPDIHVNTAFPPVSTNNYSATDDLECEIHSIILSLSSIASITKVQNVHQNKISMYEHVSYQHEQLRRQHEQLQRQHEQLQRQHEQLQQLQQMQQIQQVQQVQQMQQRYEQLFIEQQNTLVWFNDKIGLLHNEIIELRDLTTTSTISRIIGFVRRMYQFLIRR